MFRRTLQIAVLGFLVTLALAYPIIESLDYWDAPGPACDSELQEIAVLTFVGAVFLFTQLLVVLAVAISTYVLPSLCFHKFRQHILVYSPRLTASPPLPLRI